MAENEFFCWFREDKKREAWVDLSQALRRFNEKYGLEPTNLLVPESENEQWEGVQINDQEVRINIIPNSRMGERYFGLQ